MELRRTLGIIRRWLWLLILATAVAAGVAYTVASRTAPTYESQATLIVGQFLDSANPNSGTISLASRLAQTYAAVAQTRPIREGVVARLELPAGTEVHYTVSAGADSTLLVVTGSGGTGEMAALVANAVAAELIANSPTITGQQTEQVALIADSILATRNLISQTANRITELTALTVRTPEQDTELATLTSRLVELQGTLATLASAQAGNAANYLAVVESAVPSVVPVSPRVYLSTAFGGLLALFLTLVIIFLAEYLDDRVRSPADLTETLKIPMLGSIGRFRANTKKSPIYGMVTILHPISPSAEWYRTLRASVDFTRVERPIRTLVVTSAIPGEGKTTTAANLAVTYAQAGQRVILVDADLRRPGVHGIFGLANRAGLTSLMLDPDRRLDSVAEPTEVEGLLVVTSGPLPPNPAELLGSARFRTVLAMLLESADLVVLDSPPLTAVADGAVLSSFADATVLVVHAGRTRRGAVARAKALLEAADARLVGAVLNRIGKGSGSDGYYQYYYYQGDYSYGYGHKAKPAAPQQQLD